MSHVHCVRWNVNTLVRRMASCKVETLLESRDYLMEVFNGSISGNVIVLLRDEALGQGLLREFVCLSGCDDL